MTKTKLYVTEIKEEERDWKIERIIGRGLAKSVSTGTILLFVMIYATVSIAISVLLDPLIDSRFILLVS